MTIKSFMEACSKAYYAGEPSISNEEYDALEAIHGQVIGGTGDVSHMYRMYSLKKHYDKDGALPLNKSECVSTPKLDGAAVDIFYVDGHFQHALTRGDGVKGRDISNKVLTLGIPVTIDSTKPTQITGEVVAVKSVKNYRNYASGALNLKELSEWEQRKTDGNMRFIAYNVQQVQNRWGISDLYDKDMETLFSWGFEVVTCCTLPCGEEQKVCWSDIYPTDGIVYRLKDNNKFNSLGFTDKFPRGAVAWKEEQEMSVTTLLDVEWQTGKSGKVTPVAILETVTIEDSEVSRATLNNISYIEALGLEIGCSVGVILAGEIIPKIVGRVDV